MLTGSGKMVRGADKRRTGHDRNTHNEQDSEIDIEYLQAAKVYHIDMNDSLVMKNMDTERHEDENEVYSMDDVNSDRNNETRRAARTTRLRRMLTRWREETM